MMTTQDEPAVNGYDLGDLLTDIDRQCGEAVQRAAHRYLPAQRAKALRHEVMRYIGDAIVRNDDAVNDHHAQKAAG